MGDGAGILVLERANARKHAERASSRAFAVTVRVADAYHITSPDPSARYEVRAMRDAMKHAGDAG